MWVFLNGQFVSEENAVVSVFDRSFRYGDGLFETLLIQNGKFFHWKEHIERLERSAALLRIPLPGTAAEWFGAAKELVLRNEVSAGVLRVQISRGIGPRGYAPNGKGKPLVVITTQPLNPPDERPWKLITSSYRISATDPLVGHKTCSRLTHVLAAMEARERGADEALLLNTDGQVAEGSMSNVFWIEDGVVCTPPLSAGALPGITRAALLEICAALPVAVEERCATREQLLRANAAFLTFTSLGIVELDSLDGTSLGRGAHTQVLRSALRALIAGECGI